MKKLLFLLFLNLVMYHPGQGQQLSIGIKPSFLILDTKLYADLTGFPPLDVKPKGSFGIGLTLSKQIKRFGINVEPRFIVKGYKLEIISDYNFYRNNYFSLPVLLTFSPVRNLRLESGPEFAWLINSKFRRSTNNEVYENDSPNLRSFELSFVNGITYSLIKQMDLGIRYSIGLTPYDKGHFIVSTGPYTGPADNSLNYKFVHRYFEFFLCYKFLVKE